MQLWIVSLVPLDFKGPSNNGEQFCPNSRRRNAEVDGQQNLGSSPVEHRQADITGGARRVVAAS
jgi:hypothetical protein